MEWRCEGRDCERNSERGDGEERWRAGREGGKSGEQGGFRGGRSRQEREV